jgi:hypothetical protein
LVNQDIIVRVETGPPVSDFAVQSVPQRSRDPRLLLLLVAVVFVGFIWWLGDQTPEQAVPVTTVTTPSTAAEVAIDPAPVPLPAAEATVLDDWIDVLSAPSARLFLERLDSDITLVYTAVETGQMTSIQLGPDEVSVVGLRCGAASGSGFVSGEFQDQLVFSLSGSTCIVPRDGSAAPSLIENARLSFPIAETASTGWFCDDSDRQPRVAAYQVGGSLGSWIDAPGCPYLADSGRLLVSDQRADIDSYPITDFAPYWWKPGDPWTETPESTIDECEFVGIIGTRVLCRDNEVIQIFNLISGELLAEPNYLVPPGALAVGTASPSGRYLFLQWLDPDARSSGLRGGAVFDVESPLSARPIMGTSGFVQTVWTSDEQLVLLLSPMGSGCDGCGPAIHLWDQATGQSELLLPIPTEFGEFSLQLIAS